MKNEIGIIVAGLCFILSASSAAAADPEELDAVIQELRQQLETMQRRDEVQKKAILALEQRLRALESAQKQAVPPAQQQPVAPAPMEQPLTPEGPAEEEKVADEPVKKAPEPSKATETIVQEEHGIFKQRRFTLEPGITYASFDRSTINLSGFLALDAIFLGNISVDQVDSDIVTFDLTGRYGITDRLQVDATLPYIYRLSTFQSGGAGGSATAQIEDTVDSYNIGDVSFGASYRLFAETAFIPDIVGSIRVKTPTGTEPYGIELNEVPGSEGNLSVPEELPTGNGVWSASAGLSFLKTVDPALLFASLTYFYNFEESFDDIGSAEGDQPGDVDLGNAIEYGLGIAYALNDRLSLSLSYTQRFVDEAETRAAGGDWQEIIGSDANIAVLNLGTTYALTDRLTMVTNVGAGLTEDASDVQVSIKFPYSF